MSYVIGLPLKIEAYINWFHFLTFQFHDPNMSIFCQVPMQQADNLDSSNVLAPTLKT